MVAKVRLFAVNSQRFMRPAWAVIALGVIIYLPGML